MSYMRTLKRRHNVLNGWNNPKVLDPYNDTLAEQYLHPTKGYRKISAKKSKAALLTAEMKAGHLPWSMTLIQRELEGFK